MAMILSIASMPVSAHALPPTHMTVQSGNVGSQTGNVFTQQFPTHGLTTSESMIPLPYAATRHGS